MTVLLFSAQSLQDGVVGLIVYRVLKVNANISNCLPMIGNVSHKRDGTE
jgi:hypothetical protein